MAILDVSEMLVELGLDGTTPTARESAIITAAITRAMGEIKSHLRYDPQFKQHTEFHPRFVNPGIVEGDFWDLNSSKSHAVRSDIVRGGAEFRILQLDHIPVRSVTQLRVNSNAKGINANFTSDHDWALGTDYRPNNDLLDSDGSEVCQDGILIAETTWPVSRGSIKVVYTGGYLDAELNGESTVIDASPIKTAVLNEAVRHAYKAFQRAKKGGAGFVSGSIVSERLGDYAYQIGATGSTNTGSSAYDGTFNILPETAHMLQSFVHMGESQGPL